MMILLSQMNQQNILVLGFYDRQNIGDDSYKIAMPRIFSKHHLHFKSADDLTDDDVYDSDGREKFDMIIVGGGDVINRYFMKRIKRVLRKFGGRIYAFSVGIPFPSEGEKYLGLFDHIYARSRVDYDVAVNIVGSANVTYLPDVSIVFSRTGMSLHGTRRLHFQAPGPPRTKKIGICLAQPMFYKNPRGELILDKLVRSINRINSIQHIELHLFSFNYSTKESESDLVVNKKLFELLCNNHVPVINHTEYASTTVQGVLKLIDSMDLVVASRYHSVMFSVIQKRVFVPLYVSHKIDSLLEDLSYPKDLRLKMDVCPSYKPIDIDEDNILRSITRALNFDGRALKWLDVPNYKPILYEMTQKKKMKYIKVRQELISFPEAISKCQHLLTNYLDITYDELQHFLDEHDRVKGKLPIKPDIETLDVARIISFIITGNIHSPYIWGLAENMQKDCFNLFEALDYIWKDWSQRVNNSSTKEVYYPYVKLDRTVFVNVDSILKSNYSEYHRSGWAYAVGGMMSLDAISLQRKPKLLLDTYLDRTFHWGMATLVTLGILPYNTPWMGFIHHTFDTTHSEFNCVNLFKNDVFRKSLTNCKGLISLTEYLASGLRNALDDIGFANVPVYVIPHPMEFVPGSMFSMENFLKNQNRKITQIGAWLRNPFSIYELPLPDHNPLNLKKCVLRGKEMDQYFKPDGFYESLHDFLLLFGGCSERTCCEQVSRDLSIMNKYCQGMFDHLQHCDTSVTIIDKLSNNEYDKLLSENIVFLDLIDCSAVNTALECLVRNTPFIVNRHPALEEIFGKKYPGFYETILEAANIVCDVKKLASISEYIATINKNKYELNYFVQKINDIVASQS